MEQASLQGMAVKCALAIELQLAEMQLAELRAAARTAVPPPPLAAGGAPAVSDEGGSTEASEGDVAEGVLNGGSGSGGEASGESHSVTAYIMSVHSCKAKSRRRAYRSTWWRVIGRLRRVRISSVLWQNQVVIQWPGEGPPHGQAQGARP